MEASHEEKPKLCILCLKICDSNSKPIDELSKEMLEKLLLKLDLSGDPEPHICDGCTQSLEKCYLCKSSWFDTEEYIKSCATDHRFIKLNLMDIYVTKNGDTNEDKADYTVCRLCMELTKSNCSVYIKDETKNGTRAEVMLTQCFPELDLNLTENPVLCPKCHKALQDFSTFLTICSARICKMESLRDEVASHNSKMEFDTPCQLVLKSEASCEDSAVENCIVGPKKIKTEDVSDQELKKFRIKEESSDDYKICQGDSNFSSPFKPQSIKICTYKSKLKEKLTLHISNQHAVKQRTPKQQSKKQNATIQSGDSSETKKYSCTFCTYKTTKKKYLTTHVVRSHPFGDKDPSRAILYKCNLCDHKTKYKYNLKNHVLTHQKDPEVTWYKCEHCDFMTNIKLYLKRHVFVVHEETVYTCEICNLKTKHKQYLKKHCALVHKEASEVIMYKCETCKFETKYKEKLRAHQLVHQDISDAKMYQCEVCNFQTKRKDTLNNHVLTHQDPSKVNTYQCAHCDFRTRYRCSLIKHVSTHQDMTSLTVPTFKCDMCAFETKYKKYIEKHVLIQHKGAEATLYRCETCEFETKQKHWLKRHSLVHRSDSEVTMYQCEDCEYKTKHLSCIKPHRLTHKDTSEVTMYRCNSCSFESRYKKSLKNHLKGHRVNGNGTSGV